MSDDLNKKIKQITDIFGQDNIPDNVKGLLALLANSGNQGGHESLKADEDLPVKETRHNKSEMEENLEMIRKVKTIMDRMNPKEDPRINLLYAIRPFLSSSRQQKLNNCVKLLQMHNLTKMMDEQDKSFF